MWPLIAMENTLFGAPALDWDARCAAIAEAGFDGVYATPYPLVSGDLPRLSRLHESPARHGLKLAGVYANLDLSLPSESDAHRLVTHLFETVNGTSRIELSFKRSQPAALPAELETEIGARLEPLLAIASHRGFDVVLYPHSFYPLETPAQTARLVSQLNHPRLKFLFATSHVYALSTFEQVIAQLRECAARIASFNVCGCRRPAPPARCAHFPPDEGDFAVDPLLAILRDHGYRGDVIVQGHGWSGDGQAMLRRSARWYRQAAARLPAWD